MFKKAYLCVMVVILALLPSILFAQAPDTVWTHRYNSPDDGDDEACACAVDGLGNLYVTGRTHNGLNTDYLTIKYNALGETLWTRRYNSPLNDNDYATACVLDKTGNLYVTGVSKNGFNDYLTIKYSTDGDTLWTRRYSNPYNWDDYALGCSIDTVGNLYVTGWIYYISGWVNEDTTLDYLTIKYTTNGDTLWTRQYNGPDKGFDFARSCVVDSYGNLYVTGISENDYSYDYLTIKYNEYGDTLWTKRYNGPSNDNGAYACTVDSLGNLYVTGYSSNGTNNDCLTIKYNSAGDTLWTNRYDSPGNSNDLAHDCVVDGSGNLYVTGGTFNGTYYDYLTIKYNAEGDTLWSCRYNGTANHNDLAYGCTVDNLGNLYVTGKSFNGTNEDYLTIKYNTATGVTGKPEYPITESRLRLEQNKPNPFSQHTTISYQLPTGGPASLHIYNAAGQLVKTIDMGQQQAGYHQVEWNDSNILAGVYFYRLTAGNYQATKKLVVLK